MKNTKTITIYRYSFVDGKVYKKAFELQEAGDSYRFPHRYEYETDFFFEGWPAGCYSKKLPKSVINRLSADAYNNPHFVHYATVDNDAEYIRLVKSNIAEELDKLVKRQQILLLKQANIMPIEESVPLEELSEYKRIQEYMKRDLNI